MSVTISTDVFCDRCGNWTSGTTGSRPQIQEARRIAKGRGWKVGRTEDVCPDCIGELAPVVARICACGSIYLRPGPRCDDCESVHQHRRNSRRAATTYTSTERTRMANAVSQWRPSDDEPNTVRIEGIPNSTGGAT